MLKLGKRRRRPVVLGQDALVSRNREDAALAMIVQPCDGRSDAVKSLDRIKNGDINFIINTPSGKIPREHEVEIRNAALAAKIPIMTTVRAAQASANGIRSLQKSKLQVRSLQEYHADKSTPTSNAQRSTLNVQ